MPSTLRGSFFKISNREKRLSRNLSSLIEERLLKVCTQNNWAIDVDPSME